LEIRFIASLSLLPRVGIIVPRHKQTAVARNRVKRRLRELVRRAFLPALATLTPMDIVVRASPEAYDADLAALATDLARAVEKLETGVRSAER
jgi:ribonuclease P protein component